MLTAKAFGELRGVGVLAKARDLAVAQREDMHPFARDLFAGLLDRQTVGAEHENLVLGRIEFARRKIREFLVVRDELEELPYRACAPARSKSREVARAPDRFPVDVEAHPREDGCDIAASKGGVEALDLR